MANNDRSDLSKWAVEQAVALHGGGGMTITMGKLIEDARLLMVFVDPPKEEKAKPAVNVVDANQPAEGRIVPFASDMPQAPLDTASAPAAPQES